MRAYEKDTIYPIQQYLPADYVAIRFSRLDVVWQIAKTFLCGRR